MAKAKGGWFGESMRHSMAKKHGSTRGMTTKQKSMVKKAILKADKPLTHQRKVGKLGLFYMKAGKIHKVSHKLDVSKRAKHKRARQEDSWRGDVAGSRF